MDSRTNSPVSSLFSQPTFTPQAETAPAVNQLANDIVELLPDHETYVEPCASRGTLLGVKPASRNEIVNDVHGDLLHLYNTIKDEHSELVRFLAESPLDSSLQAEWEKTFLRGYRHTDDIVRAAQFFVQFASPSSVTGSIDDSQDAIGEHLREFKRRFDDVLIEAKTPHELMGAYEDDSVCMFINPPYDGSRYEYANRSLDLLIMEHLMEWQGGVGGEPYWALLTKQSPSPISMLPTTDLSGNTLTRNYSFNLESTSPFLEADSTENGITHLSAFGEQEVA
ncbi:DNA adenine methylase [Haloarcula sp. H-GB5]